MTHWLKSWTDQNATLYIALNIFNIIIMMLLALFYILCRFFFGCCCCVSYIRSPKCTRDGNQIVRKSKLVIRNSAKRSTQMKCNTCLSCQIASFALVCYFMYIRLSCFFSFSRSVSISKTVGSFRFYEVHISSILFRE